MSQLKFGKYMLDANYRQSLPPFYTSEMIIATYLGRNEDHPGQCEWIAMMNEQSDSDESGEDPDWKKDSSETSGSDSSDYSSDASTDSSSGGSQEDDVKDDVATDSENEADDVP
jgi:hypothetical protein